MNRLRFSDNWNLEEKMKASHGYKKLETVRKCVLGNPKTERLSQMVKNLPATEEIHV